MSSVVLTETYILLGVRRRGSCDVSVCVEARCFSTHSSVSLRVLSDTVFTIYGGNYADQIEVAILNGDNKLEAQRERAYETGHEIRK